LSEEKADQTIGGPIPYLGEMRHNSSLTQKLRPDQRWSTYLAVHVDKAKDALRRHHLKLRLYAPCQRFISRVCSDGAVTFSTIV
jgi:hypothetical protein